MEIELIEGQDSLRLIGDTIYFWCDITPAVVLDCIEILDEVAYEQMKKSVSCKDFEPSVTLNINSSGGAAFETFALISHIKNANYRVDTVISGAACSGGSLLSIAGRRRKMTRYSYIMVHPHSTLNGGQYHDVKQQRVIEDGLFEMIIQHYVENTFLEEQKAREMLVGDYYMLPSQALELGFVDEII